MHEPDDSVVISYGKALLVAVAVLAAIVAWMAFGQAVLGLGNPWVGLVALTTFGAAYQNRLADAPKVWIGSAVALVIGWALWFFPALLGSPLGALVGGAAIVLCLAGFIAQKLPLVCNFGLFMMLTVSTAVAQIMKEQSHLAYFADLGYAALCFWIVPQLVVTLRARIGSAAKISDHGVSR